MVSETPRIFDHEIDVNQVVLGRFKPSQEVEDSILYVSRSAFLRVSFKMMCNVRKWLSSNAWTLSPPTVAILSAVVLLVQASHSAFLERGVELGRDETAQAQIGSGVWKHVANLGGATIFTFKLTRLFACLALAALAIPSTTFSKSRALNDLDIVRDGFLVVFVSAVCDCLCSIVIIMIV